MDRTNKMLLLVATLLDKWDELPNDVKSEPELDSVAKVMTEISDLADDDSEDIFHRYPSSYNDRMPPEDNDEIWGNPALQA